MSSAEERRTTVAAPPDVPVLTELAAALPWFPSSQPVVVAVSGGADSVGLLLGLARLSGAAEGRLVVAHAEHDLRLEAPVDRAFVEDLAERLGLPCVWRKLAVRAPDESSGEGLEGRARRLRYAFLADVAREVGARRVLVAHTADDQAETILHRALRGTGVAGLAGMPRARALGDGIALVRPLLGVSRTTLRAFVVGAGATWCEDASNADVSRSRNLLRHEVLPRCVAGAYPAAAAALVRLGEQAAGVGVALASAAEHLLDLHARRQADGTILLRTRDLVALDTRLVGAMFVALWKRESWPRRDMTTRHYDALVACLRSGQTGSGFDLPGGARAVTDSSDWLRLTPPRRRHSTGHP